jgi:hypothetical protein
VRSFSPGFANVNLKFRFPLPATNITPRPLLDLPKGKGLENENMESHERSQNEEKALNFLKELYAKMKEIVTPDDCPAKIHMGQCIEEIEKVGVEAWLDGRY